MNICIGYKHGIYNIDLGNRSRNFVRVDMCIVSVLFLGALPYICSACSVITEMTVASDTSVRSEGKGN